MPPGEWRQRIEDILEAIHKIRRYVSGLSFDEFCADDKIAAPTAPDGLRSSCSKAPLSGGFRV